MAYNRSGAEQYIITWVDKLLPGGGNGDMYKKLFANLSDQAFEKWMLDIREKRTYIRLVVPILMEKKLSFEHLYKMSKELGIELYQRVWLTDAKTGTTTLTPRKYLVCPVMIRRQQQLRIKKSSNPADNNHVDELTNQPTGESKGSSMTFPELQILYAKGLIYTALEFVKGRGGDEDAFNKMNRQIIQTGQADMDEILTDNTEVKATRSLYTILKYGMHYDNNL